MKGARTIVLLMVTVLMVNVLAGCVMQPDDDGKKKVKIIDDLGREVKLEIGPEKVISLAPSVSEILYALGHGNKVVAVCNNTNYPVEAMDKPMVSGYKWLDMELILGLDPDVVFAASINEDVVPQLEERGLTVVVLAPRDMEGIFDDLRLVGKIMGDEGQADAFAKTLEARVEAITAKTLAAGVYEPKVYLELDAFMGYFTYGPDTFGDELVQLSGGVNIAGDEVTEYPMLSDEFIVASDPEVIIYQLGPWTTTTPDGIRARAGWGNITAIREDRMIGIDGDLISRPGPRLVDGLEQIARAIHPELIT